MALTIIDISKMAGVSTATVSRVLNGSEKVRPATKKKIMDIIEKYDYTPNAIARGMVLQKTKTIGILCPDSSHLYSAKAIYYLEQGLQANGYDSLLCSAGDILDVRKRYVDLLLSKKVDGLIMIGSNFISSAEEENQYIKEAADKMPVMLLNAALDYPNIYSVMCDDYTMMLKATLAMLDAGIKDVAYLYASDTYSSKKKLSGFRDAMEKYHVENYQKLICRYEAKSENFFEIADYLDLIAEERGDFHGIIASDDYLAMGCIKYAQRKGLRIPKDVSIIGYNNSLLSECCFPELTSVDVCLEKQAQILVRTLVGVLSGEDVPKRMVFEGKLIEKGTTKF